MHYRRVRTLHDQWLTNNTWLGWYDAWTSCCGNDIKLDNTAWKSQSLSGARTKIVNGIAERRTRSRRTPSRARCRSHRAPTRTS